MTDKEIIFKVVEIANYDYSEDFVMQGTCVYRNSKNTLKCLFNTDGYNLLYNLTRICEAISAPYCYELHFEFFKEIMQSLNEKYNDRLSMNGDYLVCDGREVAMIDGMSFAQALMLMVHAIKDELI